jgi:hypothetical protein
MIAKLILFIFVGGCFIAVNFYLTTKKKQNQLNMGKKETS